MRSSSRGIDTLCSSPTGSGVARDREDFFGVFGEGFMVVSRLRNFLPIALLAAALAFPAISFAIPQKGRPAPPFRVVTTSGQKVANANYRGYVLIMEFFATWCEGCRDSLPHMISLNKKYGKQGLQILGVNPGVRGDSLSVVRQFIREQGINFPVAFADDDMLIDYGVQPIPAIFVLDRKGVLVEKYVGFNPMIAEELEKAVKTLLAQ